MGDLNLRTLVELVVQCITVEMCVFHASDLNCAEEGDVALPQLEGGAGADVPVQRPLRDEGPVLRRFGLQVTLKWKFFNHFFEEL